MNLIPNLNQFDLKTLEVASLGNLPNAEVQYQVEIEPVSLLERFVVGLMDESGKNGIAVAIYPATGEVCDISHGGEVIDYLSLAPLVPGEPVPCELSMYRFGKNFVCSLRIQGEVFLYPAFSYDGTTSLTAMVGREREGNDGVDIRVSGFRLNVSEQQSLAA